jgi:hypothetical protein
MHNPLENFLLNLAEKIQTEKEYKEIVKNSESVDVNKDVFAGFIEGIANTIKENVKKEVPEETPSQPDPLDNFLATLGEKLKNLPEKKNEQEQEQVKENEPIKQEEPVEEPKPAETKPENEPIQPEKTEETPDAFAGFVNNLANILKKTPEQKTEQPVENEKPKEPVNDYVKVLSNNKKVKTPEIKNIEKKPEENEETPDIKKFVANFVTKELESFKNDLTEKYLKKAAVLSEYAGGGGTNAVQYANGGTMNGDLNVNGHILSGGRDISNFFGNGGGGGTQTLSFNPSNADLSISGGNTVSLSALSGGGGSPTDRLVSGSFLVVLSSDGTTTIPGLLTVPNLSGGAILTAAGYDDIEGFYGQSNIPVIQNGINGTIDISNVGVVTVSNSGENYTNGIAIIGGGTRIIISVTSPGWVYNSNGSITFPNGSTQTTAFTGNPDSSNWDSTYSTVYSNSASWGTGGNAQTLSFNENNAQLSLSFGNTVSLSALSGGGLTDRLVSGSVQAILANIGGGNGTLTLPNNNKLYTNNLGIDLSAGPGGFAELASNNTSNFVWVDDDGAYVTTDALTGFKLWHFDANGDLTFPTGSKISKGYPGEIQDGSSWFVSPTGQVGGLASADGQQYVQVGDNSNVYIGTGWPDSLHEWIFRTDGKLTIPGAIGTTTGNSKLDLVGLGPNIAYLTSTADDTTALYMATDVAELRANTTVSIYTNTGDTSLQWTFGADGGLTFPDNTTQTTAFTGNPDLTPYAKITDFVHLSGDTMTGDLYTPTLSAGNIYSENSINAVGQFSFQNGDYISSTDGTGNFVDLRNANYYQLNFVNTSDNGAGDWHVGNYIPWGSFSWYSTALGRSMLDLIDGTQTGHDLGVYFYDNVSINAGAPLAKLHVKGSSSDVNTPIAIIESDGSQAPYTFRVGGVDRAYVKGDSDGNLAFGAQNFIAFEAGGFGGAAEAMRITEGKNIGIGTTEPAEKLEVVGNLKVTNGDAGFTLNQGTGNSAIIDFYNSTISNGGARFEFGVAGNPDIQFWNFENGFFRIGTDNTERFRITSDGNVGIGTTEPAEKLEVNGNVKATGGDSTQWNSNYTTVSENSAYWADTRGDVTFGQNVTINGNLTALGFSIFRNTIFTTTSALSVVNNGPGPALYVSQSPGNFDVASFYDQDGIEVLHVGNAPTPGTLAKVGINESYPSTELTVRGAISASSSITVLNGNSNQWNSVYSSFNTNSAKYDSNYTTTINNSASWSSVYTSFSNQSANNASVYTTVNNNSSTTWNYQGTDIKNLTAGWVGGNSAYTSLNSNSGKYESNWSVTNTNSAFWSQAYTNLVTNSATYLGTTRQFDYVQVGLNSYSYCGFAVPGTSTASTGWTIKRLYFSTAGTLLSSGTVTNSIWNSRYSYNY